MILSCRKTSETLQSKSLFDEVAKRVGDVRTPFIRLVDIAADVAGDVGFPHHLLKVLAEVIAARVDELPRNRSKESNGIFRLAVSEPDFLDIENLKERSLGRVPEHGKGRSAHQAHQTGVQVRVEEGVCEGIGFCRTQWGRKRSIARSPHVGESFTPVLPWTLSGETKASRTLPA